MCTPYNSGLACQGTLHIKVMDGPDGNPPLYAYAVRHVRKHRRAATFDNLVHVESHARDGLPLSTKTLPCSFPTNLRHAVIFISKHNDIMYTTIT